MMNFWRKTVSDKMATSPNMRRGISFQTSVDVKRPASRKNSNSWMINIVKTVRFKHDSLQDIGYWYKKLGRLTKLNPFLISIMRRLYVLETSEWSKNFPESNGSMQSPINLVSKSAEYDPTLKEKLLSISYVSSRETDILNNGQTVVIYPKCRSDTAVRQEQGPKSVITGGPYGDDEYELAEIRFHWGRCNKRGSEHIVNGVAFPMEIQFIHWNSTLYQNLEDATGKENGIAGICLFCQIGNENPAFRALIADSLDDIVYKGRQKTTYVPFNPASLLPDPDLLQDYWVYDGSLTYPPCSEKVKWIMLRYPMLLCQEQVMEFRRLNTYTQDQKVKNIYEGKLVDNFRPVQPLNDRKIRASFDDII